MDDHFPNTITIDFDGQKLFYKKRTWIIEEDGNSIHKGLRYGENPGQEAAMYELVGGNLILGECAFITPDNGLVSSLSEEGLIQFGKHPGKINLTDMDSALNILRYLPDRHACAIMKHNNPSGVAIADSSVDAYEKANATDRLAAFGGCAVFSKTVDKDVAEACSQHYLEVIAAPEFTGDAIDLLKTKKNLRIVQMKRIDAIHTYAPLRFVDFKSLIDGGLILQQSPLNRIKTVNDFLPASVKSKDGKTIACKRQPTKRELHDMLFAWQVQQGVVSNSVLFVKDGVTVSVGAGQQDRVGVAELAVLKAYKSYADNLCFLQHHCLFFELKLKVKRGEVDHQVVEDIEQEASWMRGDLIGAVAASDAFFPKRDGIDVIAAEGVTAIIQPGGSLADAEIIAAANEADIAMVFTGQRAFKH